MTSGIQHRTALQESSKLRAFTVIRKEVPGRARITLIQVSRSRGNLHTGARSTPLGRFPYSIVTGMSPDPRDPSEERVRNSARGLVVALTCAVGAIVLVMGTPKVEAVRDNPSRPTRAYAVEGPHAERSATAPRRAAAPKLATLRTRAPLCRNEFEADRISSEDLTRAGQADLTWLNSGVQVRILRTTKIAASLSGEALHQIQAVSPGQPHDLGWVRESTLTMQAPKVDASAASDEASVLRIGSRSSSGQFLLAQSPDLLYSARRMVATINTAGLLELERTAKVRWLPAGTPVRKLETLMAAGPDRYEVWRVAIVDSPAADGPAAPSLEGWIVALEVVDSDLIQPRKR